VVYLQAEAPPPDGESGTARARFYEAYWAPETVDGTKAAAVGWWLLRQAVRPLQLLFTRYLVGRHQQLRVQGASEVELGAVERLADRYRAFADRRGDGPGSFAAFLDHLDDDLKAPAIAWRRAFRLQQLRRIVLIALGLAAAGAALGLVLLAVLWVLRGLGAAPRIATRLPKQLQPTWENALALIPVVLAALGIKRFLADHVGDVQQYVSYEETDSLYERRQRVLAAATRQLEHVLRDEACRRVVIVAHSLGTAIAFETLRDLAERNIAHEGADPMKGPVPLHKVEHLITLGSPIDKINYFFVITQSRYVIYEVLARTLRGDIGSAPFSKVGRQPHVHWINYWDLGDPIGGSLQSVTGDALGRHDVDNVRVVNGVIPHPIRNHCSYLGNERVAGDLFQVVFHRRYSLVAPPRTLVPADIADAQAVLARLRRPTNDAEASARDRLAAPTRSAIDALDANAAPPPALIEALVADLNGIVAGPPWFDEARFARVARRPATERLCCHEHLDPYETSALNRMLLEDVLGGIATAPRRPRVGPGAGSSWQTALVAVQLVIPLALVLALLETLFAWGRVGRWSLTVALLALLGGSWMERQRSTALRRLRRERAAGCTSHGFPHPAP